MTDPCKYMDRLGDVVSAIIADDDQPYILMLPYGKEFYVTTNIAKEVIATLPLAEMAVKLDKARDERENRAKKKARETGPCH